MSSRTKDLFTGRAGEFAVLSEFLIRGYNVAVPSIDLGDDVLVIKDHQDDAEIARVQVKTAIGTRREYGYSATFSTKYEQLITPLTPELHYVFIARVRDRWKDMLLIPREDLDEAHRDRGIGSRSGKQSRLVTFYFRFHADKVRCKDDDLQKYRNAWEKYWKAVPR